MRLYVKCASFSTENCLTSRLSIFFTVFLTIKTSSKNILTTFHQNLLKLHEHQGSYWRKNLLWTILEGQFLVPKNTTATKIGNGIISLPWKLQCHCNPDHNKFSSLSNTLWWQLFQISVYSDVVYAQTWKVLTLKNCIESP